jgi:hypothetical protein
MVLKNQGDKIFRKKKLYFADKELGLWGSGPKLWGEIIPWGAEDNTLRQDNSEAILAHVTTETYLWGSAVSAVKFIEKYFVADKITAYAIILFLWAKKRES